MEERKELEKRIKRLEADQQKFSTSVKEIARDTDEANRRIEQNAYNTKKSIQHVKWQIEDAILYTEKVNEKAKKAKVMATAALMISLFSLFVSILTLAGVV
ncbi:MAG: hypothetical protein Q4P20_10300 [Eubacteriales bacterium]|nr:hypothetical protein [Eubacteriales bacterium]